MQETATSDRAAPRRVGRPPRISREQIAEAAVEIGLGELTLRAVAERLGVSIPALYHHVESKDDLVRLAADHAARRAVLPDDRGQHWALWLLEWARYNRDVFFADPALLGEYLRGGISLAAIAEREDVILGVLVRRGFTILEAESAYELVSSCAVGFAVNAIRDQATGRPGHDRTTEYGSLLRSRDPADLPYIRLLSAEALTHDGPSFDEQVRSVLIGVAMTYGKDPDSVLRALRDAGVGPATSSCP